MTAVLEPRTNTEPGVTFLELEITNRCQLTCSQRVAADAVSRACVSLCVGPEPRGAKHALEDQGVSFLD
jgi:hypothetical protein